MRKLLRRIIGLISVPFIVILYLNIEVLATDQGWDTLLRDHFPEIADLGLYRFVTEPWVFAVSALLVGASIGLWADTLLRRREDESYNYSPKWIEVHERHFSRETVIMDGKRFIGCTFESCTLKYNGGPIELIGNKFEGQQKFETDNGKIYNFARLVQSSGYQITGILDKDGQAIETGLSVNDAKPQEKLRKVAKSLDDFRAEGVRLRNEINKHKGDLTDREHKIAKDALIDWSNRTLEAMDNETVPVAYASSFRTLDRFQPSIVIPNSPKLSQIVSMWNEKLTRLKFIIDNIGG